MGDSQNCGAINDKPILDRIAKGPIIGFLTISVLISESQQDFLKYRSPCSCNPDFCDLITLTVEKRRDNIIIPLDITEVFDLVSHEGMPLKFRSYGLADPTYS